MMTPGSMIADRYVIDAVIGEGAMGKIYSGRRIVDDYPVAVKFLATEHADNDEMRRRFVREATALSTLRHPNVIGVFEFGELDGMYFLVMELLRGETLASYIENNDVKPDVAMVIADQMLAGLGYAHQHGVLHRDIKTDNLYVATQIDGTKAIKLLDFGLVKFVDRSGPGGESTLTKQGSIFGSPPYMPPEQIFGEPVDVRADVYAAGVVLFELLTGIWPFIADEISDMFRMHVADPVPLLESARATLRVRPELDTVIQTAMAKSPEGRYADAIEMRQALARVPRPAAWLIE